MIHELSIIYTVCIDCLLFQMYFDDITLTINFLYIENKYLHNIHSTKKTLYMKCMKKFFNKL